MSAIQGGGTFLTDVERRLAALLGAGDARGAGETLAHAARHLCIGGGGKRARPLLVRLFGAMAGAPEEGLVEVAVAAELIHSASLLHDDVVDSGTQRRGRPTVNARWGNVVAVMSGDLVLATALRALEGHDPRQTQGAVACVLEMTRAAIAEVEARGDLELPLSALREIALGKTGALFGWCGAAAALEAGQLEAAQAFDAFGRRLGVAFQMADDIRDVCLGDEGKPRFADLAARNPSLPILLAAQTDSVLRRRLADGWGYVSMTRERVEELGLSLYCSGVLDEAQRLLEEEIEAAIAALGPYAATPRGVELVAWARRLASDIAARGSA